MKNILLPVLLLAFVTVYAQKPAKWQKIFDGKTTQNWHSYHKTTVEGWVVADKVISTDGKHDDLVTDAEFENFEFEFEFKASPKGNSGVIYKVIEDPRNHTYFTGPEYQVIDDEGYPPFNDNGKMVSINNKQKTGACYDMYEPMAKVVKPAGEWNKGRILVKDNHIEHWLNGVKVVEYEYGSDDWKMHLAVSKFAKWGYAKPHAVGHIALQGHGDPVSYRKLKIRRL
jgi:Domain of Unknown Function (DUF1080)